MLFKRKENIKLEYILTIHDNQTLTQKEKEDKYHQNVIKIIDELVDKFIKENQEFPEFIIIEPNLAKKSLFNFTGDDYFRGIPIGFGKFDVTNYIMVYKTRND
jgi:hypothetical protein